MAIRTFDDLYPAADPRDGARILRFTHHQQAHYEGVRNGAGTGKITLRGTTSDAQAISPAGLQYVRKGLINTAIADAGTLSGYWEKVIGGYFLEEGDFLALDRRTLRTLSFGGTGTLAYLDREIMWSHSYLSELDPAYGTQDPFDRLWRLWNQGDWAGGDFLGAVLWRVINEGLAYRTGATYTHRHADGETYTDSHADDKLETAIPFVTLGFTQYVDSSGNPWTVGSGEFEAQVGESLYEVTRRLMEAGLYVELDPDTFELRAWEVANHGRDRTGTAWGADVLRFQAPTAVPSTDRTDGNILNDLKRALRPFIRVTTLLTGGGEDTYAVATGSATIPWHRHHASDVNDTAALSAIASRQITARNDAGDTVQVRAKVGNDPADGYYLPGEHALLDDLVTLDTGSGTWDWADAAYPLAKIRITSRRSGAPDVFYELGASYHASGTNTFTGTGVGKHTHPPNPRLCDPSTPCEALTAAQITVGTAANGDAEDTGGGQFFGGSYTTSQRHGGSRSYGNSSGADQTLGYTFAPAQVFLGGVRYVVDVWGRHVPGVSTSHEARFGVPGGDEEVGTLHAMRSEVVDGNQWFLNRFCWTPTADRTGVRFQWTEHFDVSSAFYVDDLTLGTANDDLRGRSGRAARCDHGHHARDVRFSGSISGLAAGNVQAAIDEHIEDHPTGSGAIEVAEADGAPDVAGVTRIEFDGPAVTDDGAGQVTVAAAAAVHAHGDPSAGFRGASVKRTTDLATGANNNVVTFDAEEYDTDAVWDSGAPTRLTVPASWDGLLVRLVASAIWSPVGSSAYAEIKLFLNGDTANPVGVSQDAWNSYNPAPGPLVTRPMQVSAGDYFEMCLRTSAAATALAADDYSIRFSMELVGVGGDGGGAGTQGVWHPVMAQDPSDDRWYVVVDGSGTAVMAEAP